MAVSIDLTAEQLKQITDIYNQPEKWGSRYIAKQLGISRHLAQKALTILGLDNSGRHCPKRTYLLTDKTCTICKISFPLSEFRTHIRKKDGTISYSSYCGVCEKIDQNERLKKWHKNKRATDPGYKLAKNVSWQIWFHLSKQGSSKNKESSSKYLPWKVSELVSHLEQLFEPWMNWNNYSDYDPNTWNDNDPRTWTWNIDHIIPQSNLPYSSMQDDNFQQCWALSNLRPFSAKQNNFDGTNRIRHKISTT